MVIRLQSKKCCSVNGSVVTGSVLFWMLLVKLKLLFKVPVNNCVVSLDE